MGTDDPGVHGSSDEFDGDEEDEDDVYDIDRHATGSVRRGSIVGGSGFDAGDAVPDYGLGGLGVGGFFQPCGGFGVVVRVSFDASRRCDVTGTWLVDDNSGCKACAGGCDSARDFAELGTQPGSKASFRPLFASVIQRAGGDPVSSPNTVQFLRTDSLN